MNRAIEAAEDPRPKPKPIPRSWCIMWRWERAEQAERVGILHTTDCFMATGESITAQQVQGRTTAPRSARREV